MKILIVASLVSLLMGCQATRPSGIAVGVLRASQSAGYAVPAGAGNGEFTVLASMGAVRWGELSEQELIDWALIWAEAIGDWDCPSQVYPTPAGERVDLFWRSPKDGFCVAWAQWSARLIRHKSVEAFLQRLIGSPNPRHGADSPYICY